MVAGLVLLSGIWGRAGGRSTLALLGGEDRSLSSVVVERLPVPEGFAIRSGQLLWEW